MGSAVDILKTLDRIRTGERCTEKQWDYEIVPQTIAKVVKEHNLEKTCDVDKPVNEDPDLADRYFKAGLEAALRLGIFCTDTETVVKVAEDELWRGIKKAPSKMTLGEGEEEVTISARRPSDGNPPQYGGPLSIQMNEEYYVPVAQGILSSRLIDIHEGPSLDTVMGSPLLAHSPYETFAGFYEARLRREAQWRAGRVGMGNMLVASSSTEYGNLAAFGLFKQPQIALVLIPAALKTNYTSLHKIVQTLELGGYIESGSPTMIGGYTGGPEGCAVASIATDLLQHPVHCAHMSGAPCYDLRYAGNNGRHAIWSQTIATQAVSRNTDIIKLKTINQVSGPCTEMFFYETIAGFTAAGVSGLEFTIGPRSGGGKYKNHLTPFEAWYTSAVFKGTAGLSAEKANEILNEVIPKYEDELRNPPKGKSFPECFNVNTLEPTTEYLELYLSMRKYAEDLGIPLPPDGIYS